MKGSHFWVKSLKLTLSNKKHVSKTTNTFKKHYCIVQHILMYLYNSFHGY